MTARTALIPLILAAAALPPTLAAPPAPALAPASPDLTQEIARDGATLRLRITPGAPTVADRITVELECEGPSGESRIHIHNPPPPAPGQTITETLIGDFRLAERTDAPPRLSRSGRTLVRRTLLLDPFLARKHHLPAFTATITPENGKPFDLSTRPIEIDVAAIAGVEGDRPAPPELRGLVELPAPPRSLTRYYWAAGSALAALALAAGIVAVARRRPRPAKLVQPVPEARAALESLRAQLSRAEHLAAIDTATAAIRRYAHRRLGIPAVGMPTPEFAARLRALPDISPGITEGLASVLRAVDDARFAPGGLIAPAADASALIDAFAALVDATDGPAFDVSTVPGAAPRAQEVPA